MGLRNSVLAEMLLIALVYGLGVLFIWRRHATANRVVGEGRLL
jgi:hypothetical protein